jgi:rhodanese-related sulfurtransferase
MIVHVRLSPSYIVIKYDDGGTQYIDSRRRLAVYLPRHVPKEVAEALDALAKRGLLYVDDRRVVAIRRIGRRVEIALEDGKRSMRVKWLAVQLSP